MLLYTLSYFDRTIPSLLVDFIRADFGISDTDYSILIGFAFAISYSIAGLPFGWLVDRWSRRGVVAAGVAFWSLATGTSGMAGSYTTLLAARVGVGVGEASINPGAYSLIADYFRKDQLSRALSIFFSGGPFGAGLALVIGGALLEMATAAGPQVWPLIGAVKPWRLVFLAVGLPGLVLAVLFLLIVREPPRRSEVEASVGENAPRLSEVLAYIWQNRALYFSIAGGVVLATLFGYGTNAWYPALLIRVDGYSPAQAGMVLGTSVVVLGIVGALIAGWWSDYLFAKGQKDAPLRVATWYAVGMIIFGAFGAIIPDASVSITFVAISSFFIKTTNGIVTAAIQIITPNRMRGRVSAIYLFMMAVVAMGFGPLSVAVTTDYVFSADKDVGYSLGLVGLLSATCAIACYQFGRKRLIARLS